MDLNDKLIYRVFLKTPATKPTYVNYVIKNLASGVSLYYGRIFFNTNEVYKDIYLNDVLEGLKDNSWYKFDTLENNTPSSVAFYGLDFEIGNVSETLITPVEDTIFLVHPQRLVDKYEECLENQKAPVCALYSGYKGEGTLIPGLLPTIPEGYNNGSYDVLLGGKLDATEETIEVKYGHIVDGQFVLYDTVDNDRMLPFVRAGVLNFDISDFTKGDVIAYRVNNDTTLVEVFKINPCNSKYYLKWFDRCMGIQMQPFCKTHKRTGNYNYIDKINQFNEKEHINITVEDEISLNTGWITDDKLPYYESIFTSPYLALYDDELKEHYKITVKEKSFEYKTFHNQGRQMFNLKLTAVIARKENIIY